MSNNTLEQDKILEKILIKPKYIQTFDERNADVLALADAIGIANPDFNMKPFTDKLWDEM
jgi:hypothetical protein